MFEVKIHFTTQTITIAEFEVVGDVNAARRAAVRFAKQVSHYAVDVIDVANEDNPERAFGLVYHRDAEF